MQSPYAPKDAHYGIGCKHFMYKTSKKNPWVIKKSTGYAGMYICMYVWVCEWVKCGAVCTVCKQ